MTGVAVSAGAPAVVANGPQHDWLLVAPWWHWPAQTGHGRTSHPALQKYETSDLVNTFLADPQLRLQFIAAADEVMQITPAGSPMGIPGRTSTGVRKLYLDTHRRHYLVACELHCDATGFPAVTRDQICQAGFVIRRRLYDLPVAERTAARTMLRRLAGARQRLTAVETELATARSRPAGALHLGRLEARRVAAGSLVAQHQAALSEWASDIGLNRRLEGWIPQGKDANGCYVDVPACPGAGPAAGLAPLAGVGRWEAVGEQPDELAEGWFPLLPLVANPAVPDSDATGATIFFGLVPTGSADVDQFGTARFDDATSYEIRCFVRRHKPACPRTGPQCHCPIVWSEPTESYMLASHFDLQGTANRPVTVQLPDLNALQSDALTLPLGSAGGVRMKAPQSLMPTATFPPGGSFGLPNEICTFAIPLITIVATFVFKLFLPIVILVFQLWFMLLLKFCIPVSLDVNLASALQALPPDLSVGANFETQFGATLDTEIDDLMSGADLGNGKASQVLKNSPQPTDRIRLAKMMLSGPISPVPPSDLIFAPHVDRSTVVP